METGALTSFQPSTGHEPDRTGKRPSGALQEAVLLAALIAAVLAAYWPVRHNNFIVLDDDPYVVNNPNIAQLNWETVKWSFTTFRGANWMPLTWLSHAVDYRLFGLRPGRHHETSLLLHLLNALVLFWVLRRATGRIGRSWFVAALFALHPINVESVAWIAERKNLLSMLFFLLALGAYDAYARKPQVRSYVVVAVLFAVGLMCKPQIVTLPFVLLLWDYWPLERVALSPSLLALRLRDQRAGSGEERMTNGQSRFLWLVLEKLPLLALALASAIVTVKAQTVGGTTSGAVNTFSLAARLGNAVMSYVRYLGLAIWPARLAFFYPHARTAPPPWPLIPVLAVLVGLSWAAIRYRKHRYLVVGWFWFLGTLVPMIGVVQAGSQAMADRYAYLPFVGLFIAASWAIADWAKPWRPAAIVAPACGILVLIALSLATRSQVDYWWDDLTLWRHTAAITQKNWMAENMIGEDLLRDNDGEAAMPHFRAAEAFEPLFPFPPLHIGIYEEEHGRPREAIVELNRVLQITQPYEAYTPDLRSSAMVYLAFAYNQLGDYQAQDKYLEMAGRLHQR